MKDPDTRQSENWEGYPSSNFQVYALDIKGVAMDGGRIIIAALREKSSEAHTYLAHNGYPSAVGHWSHSLEDMQWLSRAFPCIPFELANQDAFSREAYALYAYGGRVSPVESEVMPDGMSNFLSRVTTRAILER